ncbi:hypothetical protein T484DRAFT_1777929 [Baffinella frigidus]|nr:hypothetical protein T484DRAFT_1777929 [Cryptophyta sp. CCMP2293]
MRAHKGATKVQEAGFGALCNFYHTDDAIRVEVAGKSISIEAVLAAMRAHANLEEVQFQGCWVLQDLCTNADNTNADTVARMKAICTLREVVESAIATYPSNSMVQRSGKGVLDRLA